ncbi:MAG: hypothetical protein Kow0090_15830 [Myxococcota bacterium]
MVSEEMRISRLPYKPTPPSLWRERNSFRISLAILSALCIHLFLLYFLPRDLFDIKSRRTAARPISVVSFSKADWQKNFTVKEQNLKPELKEKPKAKPPEEERLTKEEKERFKDKQIVDVAPTQDDKPPEKYDYLSEYNTKTEKETVSKHRRLDYVNPAPSPSVTTIPLPKGETTTKEGISYKEGIAEEKREKSEASEEKELKLELKKQEFSEKLRLKADNEFGVLYNKLMQQAIESNAKRTDIALRRMEEAEKMRGKGKMREEVIPSDKEGDGDVKNITLSSLMPSRDSIERVVGAPSPDHLPELEESEKTLLNSREFKYATFFNRVKKRIAQNWDPHTPYRLRDPYGNIYGLKDRYTLLEVKLTPEGDLKKLSVIKASGAPFLDDEALRAVTAAAPFPNPPSGMIENNEVTFNFGFVLEISANPKLYIFR